MTKIAFFVLHVQNIFGKYTALRFRLACIVTQTWKLLKDLLDLCQLCFKRYQYLENMQSLMLDIFLKCFRLYMTHGLAAHSPRTNRISKGVCKRLRKMFLQARNRPRDSMDKTLPLPQAIVQRYSHIQQLHVLEDSLTIQNETNLLLVTINTTTVGNWYVAIYFSISKQFFS